MNSSIPPVLRPAESSGDIHPLIAGRWSSRAIDPDRPVDVEVLDRLFKAARWAPSAMNNQPWRFLAFGPEDPGALERARGALTAGNAWALAAPRLLYILARRDRPGSDRPNPRAAFETGMAAVQMALQAAEEGLVFHQMAGFDGDALRREFLIPDRFEVITAAALGWPGPIEGVPENKQAPETAERARKELDELVFRNGTVPAE